MLLGPKCNLYIGSAGAELVRPNARVELERRTQLSVSCSCAIAETSVAGLRDLLEATTLRLADEQGVLVLGG